MRARTGAATFSPGFASRAPSNDASWSGHGAQVRRDGGRQRTLDQAERAIGPSDERLGAEPEVGVHLGGAEAAEQHRPRHVGDLARVDLAIDAGVDTVGHAGADVLLLSLIHISEPTRLLSIS